MPANQFRIGNGFLGSDTFVTTANQELVPTNSSFTSGSYSFYKFAFYNPNSSCHIRINGGNSIYLAPGQGFSSSLEDTVIASFIVVESGITANWIGCW